MRWALAALLLSLAAQAEPSARLLPQDAPAPALDLSGPRKGAVVGIAFGAVLTAVALVALVILLTPHRIVNDITGTCAPMPGGGAICVN